MVGATETGGAAARLDNPGTRKLSGSAGGLEFALRRLGADLFSQKVSWALVGGLAVTLRASPRTTADIDVIVPLAGDPQVVSLVGFLISRGWRVERELHDPEGRIGSVRLRGPGPASETVDLLIRVAGIEEEVAGGADRLPILDQFEAPVASRAALIALKVLAGRDKDREDLAALLELASPVEIREARRLLDLIERRGFDRDKDLQTELDQILEIGRK